MAMQEQTIRSIVFFLILILMVVVAPELTNGDTKTVVLPTDYREHRFYVRPVTKDGHQLTLATDTGGSQSFVYEDAVERLQLTAEDFKVVVERLKLPIPADVKSKLSGRYAAMPHFKKGAGIPPTLSPWGPVPYLAVRTRTAKEGKEFGDGFLGGNWFNGRVWTFDYPGRRLLLRPSGHLPQHDSAQRVPLAFKTDPEGNRSAPYPRIGVKIADETYEMLFDTGASTKLTDVALRELGDGRPASRGTCFIVKTVFDKWCSDHPDWRVIANSERGTEEPMVEAKGLSIGGHTVDTVWFTRRLDKNFQVMSEYMDKPIVGALGGNALRHFRVTVDYPRGTAVLQR